VTTWVGPSVGIMSLLSTVEASLISGWQILGSLGPVNILSSSSKGLEIVGAFNHLMLRGRKSLTSWLRSLLKLQLSRAEHRSSRRCCNTGSGATT
jgi:hypothetical protein